ncbi:hypothetical protein [Metamycoplasma equirhinis]|uniref:hypothetical protein n=1 Tax=Metamycoplasma equirhinis TaxID=92402 RepID=UPI003593464F
MFKIKCFEELEMNEFDGIVCVETTNQDEFIRNIYEWEWKSGEKSIVINNGEFSIKDVIQISNLTKASELFNLTAKNWLYKFILENEKINECKFIDNDIVEDVKNQINLVIGRDNFLSINVEFAKLIKDLFEVDELLFVDKEIFFKWLEKNKDASSAKKTVILKNLNWIKISELVKYIDFYNFILLKSDPILACDESNQLEICFFQNDYIFKNVVDFEILEEQLYFENKVNLFKNYQEKSEKELKKMQTVIKNKILT